MKNGDEFALLKYLDRVEKRFDGVERELAATRRATLATLRSLRETQKAVVTLRGEFWAFGKQVAKVLASHRRRIEALERRAA